MTLDTTAIKRRYQAALDAKPGKGPIDPAPLWDSVCDIPELLTEIDRLTQECSNSPQNRPENATGGEKATRVGSDGEGGLKSAHSASVVERAAKAIADEAHRQDFVMTPDEFDALSDDEIVAPTFICCDEIKRVEGSPSGIARLALESIDVDELARVLHSWDVEDGLCNRPWGDLTEAQREVWMSGAVAVKSWLTGGVA